MRFKLGYAAGFATGYYLGAKAGRQRYDQINRSLRKLWRSQPVEELAGKAKDTVSHVLPHRSNGSTNNADTASNGIHPTQTVAAGTPLGGPAASPYSSSR